MSNDYKVIGIDQALNLMVQLFGKPYVVNDTENRQEITGYSLTTETADEYDRLSQYGTPLIGTFTAKSNTYKRYNKDDKLEDFKLDDFEFPVATIVEFSRKKSTVVSATIGGKGSVKEIMGLDDWNISIKGLIVYDGSRKKYKTVKEQQKQLDELNNITGSIGIDGKIFFERGIHHIVINELRYTPIQGKPGLVQYEITALSDEEFFI